MADCAAALFGTFDVENYGDLLFPHLAARGLGSSVSELRCYSPKGGALAWADTLPSRPVHEAIAASPPAGLCLIGGGNIIEAKPTPLADYRANAALAYPALWLGAAIIAARTGARIAWNAPGVPQPIESAWARRLRDLVLAASDLLTVRDEASRVFLDLGRSRPVTVVPDTALAVSQLWPAEQLGGIARAAFERRGSKVPERWLVFHLNRRYLAPGKQGAAEAVARICAALDAVPVLVAIGPCHGDEELARELWPAMPGAGLLVDRANGLKEIAALIAHAQGYVGSSLHGLITALSYRRPALAVAQPRVVKFLGFLGPLGLAETLHESWDDAAAAAPEQLQPLGAPIIAALGGAAALIEAHWRSVRDLLRQPADPCKATARQRLLASLDTIPAPFQQWNALLDEVGGRAARRHDVGDHSAARPDGTEAERPEWEVEADALGRLVAAAPLPEFANRLERATARWPNEIRFQLLQSDLLARSGDPQGAETELRRLCERHPLNPWPRVRLTQLLAAQSRLIEARALFERELRAAPVSEEVKRRLAAALAEEDGDRVDLG